MLPGLSTLSNVRLQPLASCDRKGESKGTALSYDTLHGNSSTMGLDHMASDSKTKATSLPSRPDKIRFRTSAISLIETFKDAWQFFCLDTHPGIVYEKLLGLALGLRPGSNHDESARGGEFNRVMYQVNQDAEDVFAIGGDQCAPLVDVGTQAYPVSLGEREHTGHDLAYQLFGLYRLNGHRNLS